MNARFPIYAKILLWFFVNLAVLFCAGWFLVRGQFRFSIFTSGAARDRVERVAIRMAEELNATPYAKWDEVLAAHERTLGVALHCYDGQGRMLAGQTAALPPEVHARLGGPPRLRPPDRLRGERGPPVPRRPLPDRPPRGDPPPERDGLRPFDDGPPRDPRRGGPPRDRDDFRPFDDGPPGDRPEPRNVPPEPRLQRDDGRILVQTHNPDRYWVIIRQLLKTDGHETMGAIITSSDSPTGHGLYFDYKPIAWSAAGVLLLSALIWFPFVRGLTRSVGRLRDATEELAKGKFDIRVSEARRDEIGELGTGINRMAQRLSGYVHGQKRFLGDVAHELSAPTARLQTAVSILEQRASDDDKARLADVREEVDHMAGLVNELLQFSKASIGARTVELREVSVREVAEKAIHREAGDSSKVTLVLDGDLHVRAEPELLHRALANLIRNAIRHAAHSGPVTVSAVREDASVRISVTDHGPGIPEDALPKIFDPLYRVDAARTHDGGGIGLGLAIVKTCVDGCGGTVAARNLQPGGLEVTISLAAV